MSPLHDITDVQFEGEDNMVVKPTLSPPSNAPSPSSPANVPLPLSPLMTPPTSQPATPPAGPSSSSSDPSIPASTQCTTRGIKFPPGYYSRNAFNHNKHINAVWETAEDDKEGLLLCEELGTATEHADVPLEDDKPTVTEALHQQNPGFDPQM
ncbi:hypothetical protein PISMIDRAFT_9052 [Pisolithus microcarpus 441]|uniref:Uncharacterized protein n=1 Tax=Pisolithus microcarpus 441 TaxID=765257 RepID=A0A0C9ZKD0_9AGAM|nr:hypothetical protein PISMIDRAFT_9052 [Pisolithus microcarpus 441]